MEKIHKKIDKFPLLLGMIAIILGGTAINILNWQHKQLDKVELKVEQQQLAILEMQAEMERFKADLKLRPVTTSTVNEVKNTQYYGLNRIPYRRNKAPDMPKYGYISE